MFEFFFETYLGRMFGYSLLVIGVFAGIIIGIIYLIKR